MPADTGQCFKCIEKIVIYGKIPCESASKDVLMPRKAHFFVPKALFGKKIFCRSTRRQSGRSAKGAATVPKPLPLACIPLQFTNPLRAAATPGVPIMLARELKTRWADPLARICPSCFLNDATGVVVVEVDYLRRRVRTPKAAPAANSKLKPPSTGTAEGWGGPGGPGG